MLEIVSDLDQQIIQFEKSIFGEFCRRMSVNDIRAYEHSQYRINQEKKEHLLHYSTEMAKLNNQYFSNYLKLE